MIKDFYKTLDITKDATDGDIKKAYHRLALKYHPDKNHSPRAEQCFKEIVKAYSILGHKEKRYMYDVYLEEMEQRYINRTPNQQARFHVSANSNGFSYKNNNSSLENLLEMFGLKVNNNNNNNNRRYHMYGRANEKQAPAKDPPPIKHNLHVTLEELYRGVTRKVKFSRLAYGGVRREEKILDVKIRPGSKAGMEIAFPQEGDRAPGSLPENISFVIKEKPHPFFKRCGNDIKFKTEISLNQALCGNFVLNIPTLDGKTTRLVIKNEIIQPRTIKRIPGKGLPHLKEPKKFGDLLVEFNIKFPDKVLPKAKKMIAKTLKD